MTGDRSDPEDEPAGNLEETAPFTSVDDDAFEQSGVPGWGLLPPAGVTAGYLLLFGGVAYGYPRGDETTLVLAGHEIALLDWMTFTSLLVVVAVFGPTIVRNRRTAAAFGRTLLCDRVAALALVVLVVLVGLATIGLPLYGRPETDVLEAYQPPVGFSVDEFVATTCVGPVVEGRCYGTSEYPLGTDHRGRDMVVVALEGLRTSIKVGLSAAVITGGIGTVAGLAAGGFPGRIDTAIMRFVDVQSAVPAFFVYVLVVALVGPNYVLLVLVFGLASWGGIARVIRSEVIRVRNAQYVQVARAVGAGPAYRLRAHILPNVAGATLVPLTTLIPLYVLYEVALAFLGFGLPRVPSLGGEILAGLDYEFAGWWIIWWQPIVPAVTLSLLVLSILLAGDRMRELDSR